MCIKYQEPIVLIDCILMLMTIIDWNSLNFELKFFWYKSIQVRVW